MTEMSPSEYSLYDTRSGVNIKSDLETILDDPEIHLTANEHEKLRLFADGLLEGEAEGIRVEINSSLEAVLLRSLEETQESYYPDYFASADGSEDRHCLEDEDDPVRSLVDVEWVSTHLTSTERQKMAARSRDWYRDEIAGALQNDPAADTTHLDKKMLTVSYDPDRLLKKFEDLQKYRLFYREVKEKVKQEQQYEGRVNDAKQVILDRYVRRVNGLVAELYPSVFALAEQLQVADPTDENSILKARMESCAPVVARLHDSHQQEYLGQIVSNEAFDRFATRLDYFRNGGQIENGGFSPLSSELLAFTEAATKQEHPLEALLPREVIEKMDTTECNAEQLAQLMTAVIDEWNLLSAYSTTWEEVAKRSEPAPDNLFQVVITPKKQSLSVDSFRRVVYVPEKFRRTLTQMSPAGALPVAAHELAHVQQAIFDEKLSRQIPLARIKGRRSVTLREAGGKYQERRMQEEYFGRPYPPNLHYLRALQTKLAGGNIVQVARAFYDSYAAQNHSSSDPKKDKAARNLAADRVLRLYRFGGQNSQPLDYIEQELVVDQLTFMKEKERNAFLLAAGSFNTHDAAALRQIGMLEIPKKTDDQDPVQDVMRIFLRDFYKETSDSYSAS